MATVAEIRAMIQAEKVLEKYQAKKITTEHCFEELREILKELQAAKEPAVAA